MRILIAENDAPVAKFLATEFATEHYEVCIVESSPQLEVELQQNGSDLMILELNLPGLNGLDALRQLRAQRPRLPVLVLTESTRLEDRVNGLNSGADDYLSKPFAFSELSARVRALLRRSTLVSSQVLRTLDLELDRVQRIVIRDGQAIELTPKEFALLEYLMLNSGKNVSRSAIIQNVWKRSSGTLTNVVDVYINYLRKKIDAESKPKLIHTSRGAGYRIGTGFSLQQKRFDYPDDHIRRKASAG